MDTAKAADTIEEVATSKAASIVANVVTTKASDVLSEVEPAKAGQILDKVPTTKVTEVVQTMEEDRLVERLPEMSAKKLFQIPVIVLFQELPKAPVEQLVAETPPEVDPDLPPPTSAQISLDVVMYSVRETAELAWATIVGSPVPIEKILAKFTRKLADVQVRVEGLPKDSVGASAFGPEQALYAIFRVDIANAEPDDILAAHVTFFVEKSWLETNGIHKWSIEPNRFGEEEGAWVPFPSKRIREDDQRVYYTAVTPGFSPIAIIGSQELPEQVFEVRELAIRPSLPKADQDMVISAKVTNTSQASAFYPATLWIDNTVEAAQSIAIGAGETALVEFTLRRPEGSYGVRIDRLLTTLLVGAAPTPSPTPTTTTTPTPPPPPPPSPTPTVRPPATAIPAPTLAPKPSPTPAAVAQAPAVLSPTPTPLPTPTATALPTATPTPTPPKVEQSGVGATAIVASILGAVAVVVVVALVLYRRRRTPPPSSGTFGPGAPSAPTGAAPPETGPEEPSQ